MKLKPITRLLLTSWLCIFCSGSSSFFLSAPNAGAEISATEAEPGQMKDGTELLNSLLNTVSKWNDYCCESELTMYEHEKTVESGCKMFYKSSQLRIEVIGGGFRNGTIVVRKKDGSVRAQGGIALAHFKMNLAPDSRMLILPNGTNASKGDFPTLFTEIMEEVAHGGYKCRVSTGSINDTVAGSVVIMDIIQPGDGAKQRRIFLDANHKLPVRIDLYKLGNRLSTVRFKNLQINTGLQDELFSL